MADAVEDPWTCVLCKAAVSLDDTVVHTATGRAICLGCFSREVGDEKRMTARLRRAVEDATRGA